MKSTAIRVFDAETQRSGERVGKIAMLPAREFPLNADGVTAFKRRFRTRFEGDLTRMSIYRDIAEGTAPPGIEYFLPLFFDKTATLFDYLPHNAVIAADVDWHAMAAQAWLESNRGMRSARTTPNDRFSRPSSCSSIHRNSPKASHNSIASISRAWNSIR